MPVETQLERSEVIYSHGRGDKISLNGQKKEYIKQFSNLYNLRLTTMRPLIKVEATRVWGNDAKVLDKIIESEANTEEDGTTEDCVIIGTLYKEMKLRTSVDYDI